MSGDAHHTVQPDPGGGGAIAAMTQALELGNVPADQVVYLNAHAASTPVGDAIEQLAISKVCLHPGLVAMQSVGCKLRSVCPCAC